MRNGIASYQLNEESCDVVRISGVLTGVTRGIDSRRAMQCIHLETRVVREDKLLEIFRRLDRFQDRVRLERETGFLYHR